MHGDKTSKTKKTIVDLQKISVSDLPELQGWKEKMEATVKENPFVAIKDHETYQGAKKARTALKSARTEVQNQEKLIASKLRAFRSKVGEESQKLVFIELEEIETLSVDDWNVFFEEKRVFISENNNPVEKSKAQQHGEDKEEEALREVGIDLAITKDIAIDREIEEVDFERNLPSFLMEDELGFVITSKNVGVDVTDEWDIWLNENGIEL